MHRATMAAVDLYALLELPPSATASDIKKGFQKQARVLHPDKCNSDDSADRFHAAKLAFDILSHDIRRRVYHAGDFTTLEALRNSDLFDRDDFLEKHPWYDDSYRDSGFDGSMVDVVSPSAESMQQPSTPKNQTPAPMNVAKPATIVLQQQRTHELWVELEDLYTGFERTVQVKRQVETHPGEVTTETIALTLSSQPGWEDSTTVTFDGAGDEPYAGSAGSYMLVVRQRPHRIFQRHGQHDLGVNARVHLWGALFGSSTSIPLINGGETVLPVDALLPGQQEVLRNLGMPTASGDFGDLLVTFQVAMPAHATEQVRSTDPTRPTQWLDLPLICQHCGQRFVPSDANQSACREHSGTLVVQASLDDDEALTPGVWSCCQQQEHALGCEQHTRHQATPQSLVQAKGRAADNALAVVLGYGDPYQVGACLLWCREAPLDYHASVAMQQHNTLGLVILLRAGAEVPHTEGLQAALTSAAQGDQNLSAHLTHLLQHDHELVDIIVRMPGVSPVLWNQICQREDPDLALLLLQHPSVTPQRCRVLEQAASSIKLLVACAITNHLDCAQHLLQIGLRADGDSYLLRHTPLLKAIEHKHSAMVKLLLDYGAEPERAGYFGPLFDNHTPLAAAARTGQLSMLQLLFQSGADVDWTGGQCQRTALHTACEYGQHAAAQVLIAAGARTSLEDGNGQRPLDIALEHNQLTVVRALQPAVVQEALQSMEGLTVVRTLYDQLKYSPLICPNMEYAEIRATLLVLAQALRTLCRYSAGLDASCQADLCGTATGMSHALRAYEVWKETRDSPGDAPDAGPAAISGLVSAGVGVKTRLQQLLADMQ
eukprot:m.53182 g.53182  ORF g.53182 m.53182 type:complete len:829 (+) comp13539_c0_seq1:33-2519(+)